MQLVPVLRRLDPHIRAHAPAMHAQSCVEPMERIPVASALWISAYIL